MTPEQFKEIAAYQGLASIAIWPWFEEERRNAELMAEAQFITKKSQEEIRADAAKSPLSFADFVQLLKTGHKV